MWYNVLAQCKMSNGKPRLYQNDRIDDGMFRDIDCDTETKYADACKKKIFGKRGCTADKTEGCGEKGKMPGYFVEDKQDSDLIYQPIDPKAEPKPEPIVTDTCNKHANFKHTDIAFNFFFMTIKETPGINYPAPIPALEKHPSGQHSTYTVLG